jgi:chromosome partitioning protein
MIVFAVCNHKGGTGKTTSVMHLAAALGLSGRRTVAIDLDPQGFLTRALGVDNPPVDRSSLALFDLENEVSPDALVSMSGFDLLPSSTSLTKRQRELNKPTDVLWVKEAIEQPWADPYDVIIFDTAAAVTVYSLNAMVASEHVVVPVLPEYQSVVGAEQTFQTASLVRKRLNPNLHGISFLLTQVDARKGIHHTYREYMRDKYQQRVMEQIIRTSTSLAESYEDGSTLFDHDPHARGARDYANATDELLRRIREASTESRAPNPKPEEVEPPLEQAINP